jgi:hypothetical protein
LKIFFSEQGGIVYYFYIVKIHRQKKQTHIHELNYKVHATLNLMITFFVKCYSY